MTSLKIFISAFILFFILNGCSNNENKTQTGASEKNTEVTTSNDQTLTQNNSGGEMIEVKLPTMQCGTCKKNIETAVKKLDGINSVNVIVKDKVAKVNFDKSKTDLTKIEGAIVMAGYQANEKPGDKKAYDNLEACCKVGGGH